MIVQACLNGARSRDFHPRLPIRTEEVVRDGMLCLAAGASELHVHPRAADGKESLAAVDETIMALRRACPGTLIGVSTGAWIEGSEGRTLAAVSMWEELPDYASVNLSEPAAPALMRLLGSKGVGIEAGLASVADTERFLALGYHKQVLRILIEIDEQDLDVAIPLANLIADMLESAGVRRPVLLHGTDATMWRFVELARQRCWSTRVGLEDGRTSIDGSIASDNAALVREAVSLFRAVPHFGALELP